MQRSTADLIHEARIVRKTLIRLREELDQAMIRSAELKEKLRQLEIEKDKTKKSLIPALRSEYDLHF